jgi:hypothetical protein
MKGTVAIGASSLSGAGTQANPRTGRPLARRMLTMTCQSKSLGFWVQIGNEQPR